MGTARKTGNRRRRSRVVFDKNTARWIAAGSPFFDEPDVDDRSVWESLKDEFMALWIGEHPGTRPELWWRFEAPESGWTVASEGYVARACALLVIDHIGYHYDPETLTPQIDLLRKWKLLSRAEKSALAEYTASAAKPHAYPRPRVGSGGTGCVQP